MVYEIENLVEIFKMYTLHLKYIHIFCELQDVELKNKSMEFTLCGKPYNQVELWSGVGKGVDIVWFKIGRGWLASIYAFGTFHVRNGYQLESGCYSLMIFHRCKVFGEYFHYICGTSD